MQCVRKIDIHVHAAKTAGLPRDEHGETYATPEELIAIYDQIGVEKGVLLPEIHVEGSFDTNTNREILEIVNAYPERFDWFCNVDPRQGDNSAHTDFSRFMTYYRALGAKGVGEICANMFFDDPRMMNLFSFCEAYEMPVIFHIGNLGGDYGLVDEPGLPHLEAVLRAFPRLRLLGHSQKFWSSISGDVTKEEWNGYPKGRVAPGGRLVELMHRYPNLCCDLSAGSGYNAMTRDREFAWAFMEEFKDRIYYGTDICSPTNISSPMLRLAAFLDQSMLEGCISYDTYVSISRGNALRLLGRPL